MVRPSTHLSVLILLILTTAFADMGLGQTVSPKLAEALQALEVVSDTTPPAQDFLLHDANFRARVGRNADATELVLDNGLVQRRWRVSPNGACVALVNRMTGQSLLRSVRPEARLIIDGQEVAVGGLVGQNNHAYLAPEVLEAMTSPADALSLLDFEVGATVAPFGWKQRRHSAPERAWPPPGVGLTLTYGSPSSLLVQVHYELYDHIPVFCKWIEIHNRGPVAIKLDRFASEILALVEHDNPVETREGVPLMPPDYLHVETDFAFGAFQARTANRHVVHWKPDPKFKTQVNWALQSPCLLECEPTYGPAQKIQPGQSFKSFRTFELVYDDGNRERRGLMQRRMYRTLAPWTTENPLTHHLLSHDPEQVRNAIDQAATVGFEAIILSFGSGFNLENRDPAFREQWKRVADYAKEKGVELGAYSLLSSRNVGAENMIVSPEGQRPTHGQCPAITSEWGLNWLENVRSFYQETGFDQFENDGPYPGDVDITRRPPWQEGQDDSRWVQWKLVTSLYHDLREQGIYINAPDFYFLSGSNKCGMGYREVNWSLPRRQQRLHTRQNIYDGTWTKTPSMGWMFVPLTQYHGGGAAATIEPLHEHLEHYQQMLRSNLGLGVQAHYRGPRLFDTEATQQAVREIVDWFKSNRDILESDLIHGRRADGQQIDWMLHVNPKLETRGMLCVYNPLNEPVAQVLKVDLYYTGLENEARISANGGPEKVFPLNRRFQVEIPVSVPANGMSWYRIR